ncbi:MAG: protecting protein DprA [Gemmatimonadetes bacterium]|nr:protecting protein DprA [Gemmatimonadota bacterium]
MGDLGVLNRPCVAIVGTRRATAYAERVTRELARTLARSGACVVSGLARGVDAEAHRGALDVGGATCAVLGTGVDVVYPKAHASLQRDIGRRGLLLSELQPSNAAHAGSFPNRNRIIAALASTIIVVEAGVKSGALITARHALELGRNVAAVPGPIDVPQALGSNELLRDGASVIATMADALALMGLTAPIHLADIPEGTIERRMWNVLADGAADLDSLCARCSVPAHEGMAAVTALEIRGLIECSLSGEIRRV